MLLCSPPFVLWCACSQDVLKVLTLQKHVASLQQRFHLNPAAVSTIRATSSCDRISRFILCAVGERRRAAGYCLFVVSSWSMVVHALCRMWRTWHCRKRSRASRRARSQGDDDAEHFFKRREGRSTQHKQWSYHAARAGPSPQQQMCRQPCAAAHILHRQGAAATTGVRQAPGGGWPSWQPGCG